MLEADKRASNDTIRSIMCCMDEVEEVVGVDKTEGDNGVGLFFCNLVSMLSFLALDWGVDTVMEGAFVSFVLGVEVLESGVGDDLFFFFFFFFFLGDEVDILSNCLLEYSVIFFLG